MKYILISKIVDGRTTYTVIDEKGIHGRIAVSINKAIAIYCDKAEYAINERRINIYGSIEKAIKSQTPSATILATFESVDQLHNNYPELFI